MSKYSSWGTRELIEELERRDSATVKALEKYGDYPEVLLAISIIMYKYYEHTSI